MSLVLQPLSFEWNQRSNSDSWVISGSFSCGLFCRILLRQVREKFGRFFLVRRLVLLLPWSCLHRTDDLSSSLSAWWAGDSSSTALFCSGDEHNRKFQSFGPVESHQGDSIWRIFLFTASFYIPSVPSKDWTKGCHIFMKQSHLVQTEKDSSSKRPFFSIQSFKPLLETLFQKLFEFFF